MSNRTPKARIPSSSSSPIPFQSQPQQQQAPLQHGTTTTPGPAPSKLPRFLQKQKSKADRSRSLTDPAAANMQGSGSGGSIASSSSSSLDAAAGREKGKKGSRLGGLRGGEQPAPIVMPTPHAGDTSIDSTYSILSASESEPPVIIEPVPAPTPSNPFPRPRTRSERPISDIGHGQQGMYIASSPSTSRIGDLPTRLSGWFSHTFSSSSTDLSLPSLLSQSSQLSSSPSSNSSLSSPTKAKSALLTAARHGTRHLDKAVRYLLDSDAQPDKCIEPIWILGVKHPGYEPPTPTNSVPGVFVQGGEGGERERRGGLGGLVGRRRSSVSVDSDGSGSGYGSASSSARRAPSAYSYRGPPSPSPDQSLSQSQPPSSTPSHLPSSRNPRHSPTNSYSNTPTQQNQNPQPSQHWPPIFYLDFTSRIWLTYRSQFPVPIRDTNLSTLADESPPPAPAPTPVPPEVGPGGRGAALKGLGGKWNWVGALPGVGAVVAGGGGSGKTWTSDSGWGCMLRTGQSLLANGLLHLHLGRDWRRPPHPLPTADYASYVQILTYFLDSPSPQAPFSVHRMALAGKELGTDVGCWFGPSVAAGAIKTLVHAFPEAGLGVTVATDGCIYQSEVFTASTPPLVASSSSGRGKGVKGAGREKEREKGWGGRGVLVLVGIRLGLDGVNPVYYETIKTLYTFPQSVGIAGGRPSSSYYFVGSQADNLFYLDPHHARPAVPLRPAPPQRTRSESSPPRARQTTPDSADRDRRQPQRSPPTNSTHQRVPTSPTSTRTGASSVPSTSTTPLSPSPLQKQFSTSSRSSSSPPGGHRPSSSDLDFAGDEGALDAVQEHYVYAYTAAELKTFHCERVRKMPLSGLDPSMLLGFLCKDKEDWEDFRRRVVELGQNHKTIFTIQDEPPTWPSDSDEFMGLESISEPDDMDMDDEGQEEEGADEPFFDTREGTRSPSTSPDASVKGGAKSSDVDTEEDPMGPITPRTTFEVARKGGGKGGMGEDIYGEDQEEDDEDEDDDEDDEDWVDPSSAIEPSPPTRIRAPPMAQTRSNGSTSSSSSSGVKVHSKNTQSVTKKQKLPALPIARTPEPPGHYPFPSSMEDTPQQEDFHPRNQLPQPLENGTKQQRMHTARARDGGRTQSGGVKGVPTEDSGENF